MTTEKKERKPGQIWKKLHPPKEQPPEEPPPTEPGEDSDGNG